MMAYREDMKCEECGKFGSIQKTVRTGADSTGMFIICINCFVKRMRKAPNWYNVKTIQDEFNEIEIMHKYLEERSNEINLPHENFFNWIVNEDWESITAFRLELGKKVLNELKKEMKDLISEFEKIPSVVLETEQFKRLKKLIQARKDWTNKIEGDGDNAVNWIKRVKKTINGSKDTLEEFQHSWERSKLISPIKDLNASISLSGLTAFISGRLINLQEDRTVIKKYLESIGMHVLRFEDIASTNTPEKACLEMVDDAEVYIGVFGSSYGNIVLDNKSATELEFNRATSTKKIRLIFIKKEKNIESRQKEFLDRIKQWDSQESVLYKSYIHTEELKESLKNSISEMLRGGVLKQIQK